MRRLGKGDQYTIYSISVHIYLGVLLAVGSWQELLSQLLLMLFKLFLAACLYAGMILHGMQSIALRITALRVIYSKVYRKQQLTEEREKS